MSGRMSPRAEGPRYVGRVDVSPAVVRALAVDEAAADEPDAEGDAFGGDAQAIVLHSGAAQRGQRPPPPPVPTDDVDPDARPVFWQMAFVVENFSGETLRRSQCPLAVHSRLCLFFLGAFRWAFPNSVRTDTAQTPPALNRAATCRCACASSAW